jgi:Rrf2 family protein
MQITRQADYAVRAVLFLAEQNGTSRAPTSQIAREQKIPPSFLAKIVSQLSVAGMVQTSRGARGGVALAKEPRHISLLEVVEAIDGPITLNECVVDPDACTFGGDCPVRSIWCQAQARLVRDLAATSFADLLDGKQPAAGA